MELEPVRFFEEIAAEAMLASRESIAKLVGCDADDIALIENATTGVNTVMRSLELRSDCIGAGYIRYCEHATWKH